METMVHIVKGNIGIGILTLPMAIRNSGLIFGVFGIGVIAAISVYCMKLLVRAAHRVSLLLKFALEVSCDMLSHSIGDGEATRSGLLGLRRHCGLRLPGRRRPVAALRHPRAENRQHLPDSVSALEQLSLRPIHLAKHQTGESSSFCSILRFQNILSFFSVLWIFWRGVVPSSQLQVVHPLPARSHDSCVLHQKSQVCFSCLTFL